MKRMKYPPLFTLAITAQMILSPYAHAQNLLQGVQMFGSLLQQNQQNIQAQRQAQANQQLVGQMTAPGPDKYFKDELFARIPGFYKYLAESKLPVTVGCATLPTTLTEIKAEVCRLGVTNDRGADPNSQLAEMFSLHKTYGDVSKAYEGYISTSNAAGQGFGAGCMKNALQALNGFMSKQSSDIDNMLKNIALIHDRFKEQTKGDLNLIEETTAQLEGGNSELADEVRSRRPDLFDFGKRFENPACKSMYAGDAINNIAKGSPGGYNQISRNMKEQFAGKSPGAKFSGESYVGAHGTVVEEINKMANSAAEQFKLNFQGITGEADGFSKFLGDLPNAVSSTSGLNRSQFSADFFADVQQKFNKQNADIVNDLSVLQDDLRAAGADPSAALRLANNLNAKNFETEVGRVQNQIRNGCVQRAFGGEGFWDGIRKNIKDPQASKFANKNEFNALRQRIQEIMTDPVTTPESKIAQVRALEQAEGSRFILNTQGSYQKTTLVNGKAVTTNELPSNSSPSKYFNDIVTTCDAQFSVQKLGSMTGSGAIQKLRDLNTQYKNLATAQMSSIRNEIRNKLINCENSNEANNQVAGSCNRDRFNTNAPGFCANAAFSCANNMRACTGEAEKIVKKLKDDRNVSVQRYKQNMERNKQEIKAQVANLVNAYTAIGSAIAGLNLGATFNAPLPEYDIKGEGKFLDSFRGATANSPDGALLLEDPDKYIQLMRTNAEKIKAQIAKTQQELTGRGGVLAQHIEQTTRNYQTAKAKADEISRECIAKHDDFVRQAEQQRAQQLAEQKKKFEELGEKRQEFCARFSMLDSNPLVACEGNLLSNIQVAGQLDPSGGAAQEISTVCQQQQSQTEATGKDGDKGLLTKEYCSEYSGGKPDEEVKPETSLEERMNIFCARISKKELKQKYCEEEPGSVLENGTEIKGKINCDDILNDIIITAKKLKKTPSSENGINVARSDSGGAPAFCNAGFNGDRFDGSGGSRLEQIAREFGIPTTARVQGQ